jgi:hypothetical protein
VQGFKGAWDNVDAVKYRKQVSMSDRNNTRDAGGASAQFAEFFQREGTVPEYFITGKRKRHETDRSAHHRFESV